MDEHRHATLSGGGRHARRLAIALGLVVVLLVVELSVALTTGSLALLSDAGHLATDVVGLGLALAAVLAANRRPPSGSRSFGWYRLEILAALTNALLLLGIAAVVLVGAIRRIGSPVHVEPGPLLVVASIALAVNLFCAWLLRAGAEESLNLQGARLEVLADAVGSIGVLLTALIIWLTDWQPIDSIVAVAIAGWLVPRAVRLARRSLRILMQHAPEGVDLDALATALRALPGVAEIHDLHVWTLTSGMDVASVHVMLDRDAHEQDVRAAVRAALATHGGLDHATVQIEPADDPTCGEAHPTHW